MMVEKEWFQDHEAAGQLGSKKSEIICEACIFFFIQCKID